VGTSWAPRLREASWFLTGHDGPDGSRRYANRYLFLRLEQDLNGAGEWTVELRDCHRGSDGHAQRAYHDEQDARSAMRCIYALSVGQRLSMSAVPVWLLTSVTVWVGRRG
jgi:hypothetical protein